MYRKRKLASSPTCLCGQDDHTTEHVLQRWPLHKATREDTWPVSTSLTTKLYGCEQELEKTTFTSRAALAVQPANVKKKKKKKEEEKKKKKHHHLDHKTLRLAASRSWRRRLHSFPEQPWSCSLRTPRRRRRRRRRRVSSMAPPGKAVTEPSVLHAGVDALPLRQYRRVGLVAKASASRAEDPGFETRLRRDFSGVESYQ